jgi:hypothetical protein
MQRVVMIIGGLMRVMATGKDRKAITLEQEVMQMEEETSSHQEY